MSDELTWESLARWCEDHLGSRPSEELFRAGHLSTVVGVRLSDGREVVVKARPASGRLRGCVAVQAALAARGFPCPRVLADSRFHDDFSVTAEEHVPGGHQLGTGADDAARSAELLHRLLSVAPSMSEVPSLSPSPPWTAWDREPSAALWPPADDRPADLNSSDGPAWLDEVARGVRERLMAARLPPVIGHGDWENQNMRWRNDQPHVVHDWDSVIAQPEVAIVGLAAAVWPAAGNAGEAATVQQTEWFLDAYESARGKPWSASERELCWAAGLWVRAFNAKKDASTGGGPQLDLLAAELADRRQRAGMPD